jgi:LysM repeat protein
VNRIRRAIAAAPGSARVRGIATLAVLAGAFHAAPALAVDDPRSTHTGDRLSVEQVIQLSYDAGLRSEEALVSATSIAIAESSLWTQTRNWHPEYGYRDAAEQIGVEGPSGAWNASHTRQLHSDRGLWQISSHWWGQYSDAQADDPAEAARIVATLSDGGRDFHLWDTFAHGSAQRLWELPYDGWPAVRPLVARFLENVEPQPSPSPPPEQRTHVVNDGDTLYRLAARFYGDGRLWTRIAEANGIDDPTSLRAGQTLIIP